MKNFLAARLALYAFLSSAYWMFMNKYAPLRIAWRPFHESRIFEATNNIVNGNPIVWLGITSWDSLSSFSKQLLLGQSVEVYLTSAFSYFPQAILAGFYGFNSVRTYGPACDFAVIVIAAIVAAEILARIFRTPDMIYNLLWPVSGFILYLVSPWSYRMFLAPWDEVPWTLCILTFYLMCLCKRRYLALLALVSSGLFHWMWSALLSLFYVYLYVAEKLQLSKKSFGNLMPSIFRSNDGLVLVLACTFPVFLAIAQSILLKVLYNVGNSGSDPLYRIGIDSAANIHHGGILASLQFLGGNRLSACLSLESHNTISESIAKFNCFTSISSWMVISCISIAAYLIACIKLRSYRWILLPISWAFATFFLVFQQSTAVHLQGYSFVFNFIYMFGLVYTFNYIARKLSLPSELALIAFSPLVLAICINAIRVSFFTGING